ARPLVDRADLGIAIQLLDRVLPGESIPTMEIDTRRGDPLGRLRRVELRHSRLPQEGLSSILQTSRVVDEETCRLELRGHAGELELNSLEVRNRAAELLPLLYIAEGGLESAARQADHLCPDPNP